MSIKQSLAVLALLFGSCEQEPIKDPPVSELPSIVINEFLASNQACCTDPAGEEEYDDWFELYNAGNVAVDIGGWYVTDKENEPRKFQIPNSEPEKTTLQPGEYLVVWADNQPDQGVLHLDFALSADGEYIGILNSEGQLVDETTFGAQSPDVSSARVPNGSGEWGVTNSPSPGAPNQ